MNATTLAALVLILAGVLGLAYGGLTSTEETLEAGAESLSVLVEDIEDLNLPAWAGFVAILLGAELLLLAKKR